MEKQLTIALELLGPVLDLGRGGLWDSRIRPGARAALRELSSRANILIHTVLVSDDHDTPEPTDQATQVERYLHAMGIPFDWTWNRPGKPHADYYVETADDLEAVLREILLQVPPDQTLGSIQPPTQMVQGLPEGSRPRDPRGVQASLAPRRGTT